jgi:hypothetical protein
MPNTTGGAAVREAVGAGLAHRLTSFRSEQEARGSKRRGKHGYTAGATEIGGKHMTGRHEAAARKAVKGTKVDRHGNINLRGKSSMFSEKLHGPKAVARVHKNRVAASRRVARKGKKKAG